MGFELEETLYVLRFEEPKYEGLVVKMREATIGNLVDLAGMDQDAMDPAILSDTFKMLADSVAEWNLEVKGEPVGTAVDNIRRLPVGFVMDLLKAWQFSTVGVSAPLDDASMNGKPPPELSLQTAV